MLSSCHLYRYKPTLSACFHATCPYSHVSIPFKLRSTHVYYNIRSCMLLPPICGIFPSFSSSKMSQEQKRRPQDEKEQPIRYGDVFNVSGDLASMPVAPQDAAMMQTAKRMALGQTPKGGPAAVIQSAATRNKRAGLVGHRGFSDVAGEQGVTVTETDVPGSRMITESVAGQVVGQHVEPTAVQQAAVEVIEQSAITIGEALEAVRR